MQPVKPLVEAPLNPEFEPPVLADQAFLRLVDQSKQGVPLILALERDGGRMTRYETRVLPPDHPQAAENAAYVRRLVKTLLWARGGWRLVVGGPYEIGEMLQRDLRPDGVLAFDEEFMSGVYERSAQVEIVQPDEVPAVEEAGIPLGGHLEGCRIGFDAGASDYKVAAVVDGEAIYSEEFPWDPKVQTDPEYHYGHIMHAMKSAAAHMPRVDAIGVSSAGIYINNRVAVASLFRGIPKPVFDAQVRDIFLRVQEDMGGMPLEVANDGDVTALAGAMSLSTNRLLGIAMGSSEAAGYIDHQGCITGWLNELAFVPVDVSSTAAICDWSEYPGAGSQYLCQVGVVRMAQRAGIETDRSAHLADQLVQVQEAMAQGDERAVRVYETVGVWAGYAVAYYAQFYELAHVLLLGRVTSGEGGSVVIARANEVLQKEFPELGESVELHLPGEAERRVGQAIAAASLPEIKQ